MSNSYLHKQKGKYNNLDVPIPLELQNYFDRCYYDIAEAKYERNKLREKILRKDLSTELNDYHTKGFNTP